MDNRDPQKVWEEYYERIKARRISEAELLWAQMEQEGISADTVLALDFLHFSNVKEDAEALAKQLAENYSTEVVPAAEQNYWNLNCTTRPSGICLSREQHVAWVEFMCDVAHSYACVFSTWSLESAALGKRFNSELSSAD